MSQLTKLILLGALFCLLCLACILYHGETIYGAIYGVKTAVESPIGTPPAAAISPSLSVKMENGKIVLTGMLPDQATKDKVIARAKELYGEGNYEDQLKVDASAKQEGWLASAVALLPPLGKEMTSGEVGIKDGELVATGELTTQAAKDDYLKSLQTAFEPGLKVIDKLTVAKKADAATIVKVQNEINDDIKGKIIEFDTNSDAIRPNGKKILDTVAAIMKKDAVVPIEVAGYTDASGDPKKNLDLSQRRATAVKKYLVGKGVSDPLTPKGYGIESPVASNTTSEGKQKNRRIEFHVNK